MADVVEEVRAVAALAPDEQVEDAVLTEPRGGTQRSALTTGLGIGLGGDVGGLAGSLAGGMASLTHTEKVVLAVTNQRLLLCEVTPVRFQVTRVAAAIPLADITSVTAGHSRSGGIKIPAVDIELRDGTTHSYEVGLTQKHHLSRFEATLTDLISGQPTS